MLITVFNCHTGKTAVKEKYFFGVLKLQHAASITNGYTGVFILTYFTLQLYMACYNNKQIACISNSPEMIRQQKYLVWNFLNPVKSSDVIQCINGRRQSTMKTKYLQQIHILHKTETEPDTHKGHKFRKCGPANSWKFLRNMFWNVDVTCFQKPLKYLAFPTN